LYLFNDITTKDISASNKYDDIRSGPHLDLEVQEGLYNGLYTSHNLDEFQSRFCHHFRKICLFIFLPSKPECWTTYFVCSSNCI